MGQNDPNNQNNPNVNVGPVGENTLNHQIVTNANARPRIMNNHSVFAVPAQRPQQVQRRNYLDDQVVPDWE